MEELGALEEDGAEEPGCAGILSVVKGAGVEPEAVDCSAEFVTFLGSEEAPRGVVFFPLLERVDVGPFVGNAADADDLGEEREGYWHAARDVGGLGGVVGEELD